MKIHHIPFQQTGYFSKLICDYLDKHERLHNYYNNFPDIDGFKAQINEKANFSERTRSVLVSALNDQYQGVNTHENVENNIELLKNNNTFTITTGHQLNIFTGPLYFLYKIVSVINLCNQLKEKFPSNHFVPVYWMATEDHDFEEINYFNFKGKKVEWKRASSGAVGRLETESITELITAFSNLVGNAINAEKLKILLKESYSHNTLTEAMRYLVNALFGDQGLVILDGDDSGLKEVFRPKMKDELLNFTSFKAVSATNEALRSDYKIQVNPREINLFYMKDAMRERIVLNNDRYKINGTGISFSKEELLEELKAYPDRFSPNVIMRPLYQETILPNLCYIGGGGELAYWMQLKSSFEATSTVFPILLLRNSVLMISERRMQKLQKLNVALEEVFCKQGQLIDKKVKEFSEFQIDFSNQKLFLQHQFEALKELANKTDKSFTGAVLAQEKKQLNGLDKLEKRLLRAQRRKLTDEVERLKNLQNALFPNQSLEERSRNFSEYYLEFGDKLIPMLLEALDPLKLEFTVIEY